MDHIRCNPFILVLECHKYMKKFGLLSYFLNEQQIRLFVTGDGQRTGPGIDFRSQQIMGFQPVAEDDPGTVLFGSLAYIRIGVDANHFLVVFKQDLGGCPCQFIGTQNDPARVAGSSQIQDLSDQATDWATIPAASPKAMVNAGLEKVRCSTV